VAPHVAPRGTEKLTWFTALSSRRSAPVASRCSQGPDASKRQLAFSTIRIGLA